MSDQRAIKCPWCEAVNSAKQTIGQSEYGKIVEMRCEKCGDIISAYLQEDRRVLETVRTF